MIINRNLTTRVVAWNPSGEPWRLQRFCSHDEIQICRECRDYLTRYQVTRILYTKKIQTEDGVLYDDVPSDLITAIVEASSTNKSDD